MSLRVNYKKKKYEYASLKSLKKGVRSGVGSGFFSQRYGSALLDLLYGFPTLPVGFNEARGKHLHSVSFETIKQES
jgi:hypothetical protein